MIWARLKNLWRLSEVEFISDGTHRRIPEYTITPPNNVVQIIKKEDVTEEFLKQNGTK